jgi:hypothetical protein
MNQNDDDAFDVMQSYKRRELARQILDSMQPETRVVSHETLWEVETGREGVFFISYLFVLYLYLISWRVIVLSRGLFCCCCCCCCCCLYHLFPHWLAPIQFLFTLSWCRKIPSATASPSTAAICVLGAPHYKCAYRQSAVASFPSRKANSKTQFR